jgi:uncharacterized glyoxalase superfamily protein PhnB
MTLSTYFGYRDATAAIDWLDRAFGFKATMQFPDDQGGIAHAELCLGQASIILFSDHDGYERPPRKGPTAGTGTYIVLADQGDVDVVYDQAVQAGATSVWKPEETEWGNYRCRVLDPEGYEWTFGIHRPGQ